MASGNFHDRSSIAMLSGLAAWAFTHQPLDIAIGLCGGFAVGFLWLSPDVDGVSKPFNRWGVLADIIWGHYQDTHGHRSVKLRHLLHWDYRGHWPVVGSIDRLLYLLVRAGCMAVIAVAAFVGAFLYMQGNPDQLIPMLSLLALGDRTWLAEMIINAYLGVEGACCLHIFCDYCPGIRKL